MKDSAAGNCGNSLRGVASMSTSHSRPSAQARVGQLIDGAFWKALISLGLADGDQAGLIQAFEWSCTGSRAGSG